MKIEIRNRWTNDVIYSCEAKSLKAAIEDCVRLGANLAGASLYGARLYGANLAGASLYGANLAGASLYGANLAGASLDGASLDGANLAGASLYGANLDRASLDGANLAGASLYGANLDRASLDRASLDRASLDRASLAGASLYGANLAGASLDGASLDGANLAGASLDRASLYGAIDADLAIARTRILPEGSLVGYKKVSTPTGHGIVTLHIPAAARRSHAFGRKCRCEFAEVVEAPDGAYTDQHGPRTEYKVGEIVKSDSWDENWMNECSNGIHFFITREEAEAY